MSMPKYHLRANFLLLGELVLQEAGESSVAACCSRRVDRFSMEYLTGN